MKNIKSDLFPKYLFISVLFLSILFINVVFGSDNKLVANILSFDFMDEGYFKAITDFELINNNLYIIDFFQGKIILFKLTNDRAEFEKYIGKYGQGPGDIQRPLSISSYGKYISIEDQEAISIFDNDGGFINKFRVFSSFISRGSTVIGKWVWLTL